jgi:hypothetical protein
MRLLVGAGGALAGVLGLALAVDQVIALWRDGLRHAPNEPTALSGFILFAAMAAAGAWVAWWGFRALRAPRPDAGDAAERAILVLLAGSGPLTETQLVLQTGLRVRPLRAVLERLCADGLAEMTLTEDGAVAYRAVGVPKPPLPPTPPRM